MSYVLGNTAVGSVDRTVRSVPGLLTWIACAEALL